MKIDCVRMYEIGGQVCPVLAVSLSLAIGNNQTVVAAATGKRHRIMGWICQAAAAGVSQITLKSNSGGASIMAPLIIVSGAAGLNDKLPIVDSGYAETSTGHDLVVDVITNAVYCTFFYITYTP